MSWQQIIKDRLAEQAMDSPILRWMKETEDGCIVEFTETCDHGAAYPMLQFEEEIDERS